MIVIKKRDPYWIVNLIKDLDALGIPNVYDGSVVKFELCGKKIALDNKGKFPNVHNKFVVNNKDFNMVDIEGLKEHLENLFEKNKQRVQAKNLIKFDSEMFEMLFDGKVSEVPGLEITKKTLNFSKGKWAHIELEYLEDPFSIHYYNNKKYIDLKDVDLFEIPWNVSGLDYITLTEFFEKFAEEDIKNLQEKIGKLEYEKSVVENELAFLETTPKTKRDEQCKKDITWRKSEISKIQRTIYSETREIFGKLGIRHNHYEEDDE